MTPGDGPLAGVRVLELGSVGPGPWACMVLAGLGASVLRVDRPDAKRHAFPGQSVLARGRTRISLDLKLAADRERVLGLAGHADVLVEGFRAGVAERLGLGPQACQERNPRLVYGRMSGWGQDGPMAALAGHDLNYLAASGALAAMVDPDHSPSYPLSAALTFGGGSMFLVSGIIAALYERQASGQGQVVDAAIADGMSMLLASSYGLLGKNGPPLGSTPAETAAPYYATYLCADGKRVAVAAYETQLWRALIAVLGLADDEDRHNPEHWPAMREQFRTAFAQHSRAEWVSRFAGVDAAFSPVLELGEVPDFAQAQARQSFTVLDGRVQPTMSPKFSRTPTAPPAVTAPADTAWTTELLAEIGFEPATANEQEAS
ncbi:MAG: L-carnitine dehydratase/bile acid-inducible protein [Frankiales bacterium]|nr:L-carnitine dehydratase/bile acid-inducible protein [Frankiales bacterium]